MFMQNNAEYTILRFLTEFVADSQLEKKFMLFFGTCAWLSWHHHILNGSEGGERRADPVDEGSCDCDDHVTTRVASHLKAVASVHEAQVEFLHA